MIAPELEKYREESKGLAKSEEDVLSYALFPQVAKNFLENRNKAKEAPAEDEIRTINVVDFS